MEVFAYLAKVSALTALFYIIYVLLLKKDTYHNFKRAYFICGLLVSALMPFVTNTQYVEVETDNNTGDIGNNAIISLDSQNQIPIEATADTVNIISLENIAVISYIIVSSILLIVLLRRYLRLFLSFKRLDSKKVDTFKFYTINDLKTPFSFFNHIVLTNDDSNSSQQQMILAHEKIHASHFHSADILLVNLFTVVFWINPIIWFYRKDMKQNLEHIADQYALKTVRNARAYQQLMLKQVLTSNLSRLQTYFFQPSIKQRITMINKTKTSTFFALKSIILVPFLVLYFINFQTEIVAQEKEKNEASKNKTTNTGESPWQVSVSDVGIEYSDNVYSSKTEYGNLQLEKYASKPFVFNLDNRKKIKNDRVIIKINRYADLEFLEYVKTYLLNKHDITITYRNLRFNDDGMLTGIDLSVVTKDGFSGTLTQMTNSPLDDIYVYRDYTKGAKVAFGVGSLPDFPKHTETGELISSIQLAPGKGAAKKQQDKDGIKGVNLENVETYIINGETFKLTDLPQMIIIPSNYSFTNNSTFKVEGKVLKGKEFDKFYNSTDESFDEQTVIFIDGELTPYVMTIRKTTSKRD